MFLGEMSCKLYYKKECKEQKEHHSYKFGTWKFRTLKRRSKLQNLKTEMLKNNVSVLGVIEVRWRGQSEIRFGVYIVYYSGGGRAERGKAIVVHKSLVRSAVKRIVCTDRIIGLKLRAEPVSILIMQVYMATSEHEDDEVEKFYDATAEILVEDGKDDTNNIIMGDWNSVVGDESYRNIVGSYGLGRRNHRSQILIDYCERNGLIVTNTWFKKPKRRLRHGIVLETGVDIS